MSGIEMNGPYRAEKWAMTSSQAFSLGYKNEPFGLGKQSVPRCFGS
jgi:hypothetical protein